MSKTRNKDMDALDEFFPDKEDDPTKVALQLLVNNKRKQAAEILVRVIETRNHIYALRDDKKEELWIYKDGIYVPEGKSYIKEFCRKNLGSAYTTQFVNMIIDRVIVDNYISHDEFFQNNYCNIIPVSNGLLNLENKELLPFTPEKIFFSKINAEYDSDKDCPKIKKFFKEILHKEDVPAMQELFGFILWKDNFTETSFLYRGGGSNGKSKTIELMKKFLNPENVVSVPLSQLEKAGSFQVSELQNKLVNMAGELSSSALKETQMFKFLTGRDSVTADRKFLRPVTFVNYAKLIFSCNDRPPTYDLSDGFFRRWIVFHFKKRFVDQEVYNEMSDEEKEGVGVKIPNIVDKIISHDELSGLLNWGLEGLQRLLDNKKFSNTKSTEETRVEWLEDSNNFVVFFEKEMTISSGHLVSKDDVRKMYTDFCETNGLDPVSDKAILWYMKSKGVGSARRTKYFGDVKEQVTCWVGCRFEKDEVDARGWSSPVKNDVKDEALKEFNKVKEGLEVVEDEV